MGVFESQKSYSVVAADLELVAADVEAHFKGQGYETNAERTLTGVLVSISRGNVFKAVLGMRTALNIEISRSASGTSARAYVGLFGSQAIPTALALFVTWPVLLTQIWGLVRQSKLDEEAIRVVEESLLLHGAGSGGAAPDKSEIPGVFCPHCGQRLGVAGKFCSACGAALA